MTTTTKFLRYMLAGLSALGLGGPASAEDIDIFRIGTTTQEMPNVLLILDNSANWTSSISVPDCYFKDNGVTTTSGPKASNPNKEQGKKMAIEKCALYNVIDSLTVTGGSDPNADAKYNVAIMLLNESPHNGSYPRKKFIPLTTNNKTVLKTLIKNLAVNDDKGSNADFARALYEAFLWYTAAMPYNGNLMSTKVDTEAFSGGRYVSPAIGACGRNHVILIANGGPQSTESDILTKLQALHANTTQITYTNPAKPVSTSDQNNWADEMSRYMGTVDVSAISGTQDITVHTVAVTGASSDGTYPNFIEGIATVSGGIYKSANNVDDLEKALNEIFNAINGTNSVFASASLPVSVNARGTYLNRVYIGMFRPDSDAKPRWRGNLKQYQFGFDGTGGIQLVDANGDAAINADTGFIIYNATSFWTSASTFWINQPLGDTTSPTSDAPDGNIVEKGGAAQKLRTTYATSQSGRKVYTCPGCTVNPTTLGATSSTTFNTSNASITQAALGVTTATDKDTLINWVRGTDNAGDESGPGGTTTIRPSVHGDVLHSRPAVVDYGGTTGVVVFYGSNDGMLHAVNGEPDANTHANAGKELWSFVPDEVYSKLKRLRSNSPEVVLPTVPGSTSARDSLVDGPIGVYRKVASNGTNEKVYIYFGLRRGGRVLYAFDVTDPTLPKFMWRKTNSSAGFSSLGQTWSEPKVARIKRTDANGSNPVIIFGGGYDATAEDQDTTDAAIATATTMGKSVYVVDAVTGTLLREFTGMTRSVSADVTLLDSDFDGYVDRVYAADLGGQVWRIDFETTGGSQDASNWTIYKVADLSGGTTTGRKFMFPPDAVMTKTFTALMIGSGDREKPLKADTTDHFFAVYDTNTSKGVPSNYSSTTAPYTPIQFSNLASTSPASLSTGKGCYQTLETGEKVVNAATSIGGVTYFGTNKPGSTETCGSNLGTARSYAMPLFCVAATYVDLKGGGLPPSPVAGIVTIVDSTGTSRQVPFVIGAPNAKNSAIEGTKVNPTITTPRSRIYWYQENAR